MRSERVLWVSGVLGSLVAATAIGSAVYRPPGGHLRGYPETIRGFSWVFQAAARYWNPGWLHGASFRSIRWMLLT